MPTRAAHYHHGNLAEALLGAVGEIIDADGVDAVSLRAAARRVGVSHAAPTHHFGDKRGLLTAFATRGFQRFVVALRDSGEPPDTAALTGGNEAETRLLACGAAYVRFAMEQRHFFEVMFRPELVNFDDEELHVAGDAAFGVLLERVAACRRDGDVEDPQTRRAALAAWAFVHGLAHLLADGPLEGMEPDLTPEAAVEATMPVLREGLRAQPGWRTDDDT